MISGTVNGRQKEMKGKRNPDFRKVYCIDAPEGQEGTKKIKNEDLV